MCVHFVNVDKTWKAALLSYPWARYRILRDTQGHTMSCWLIQWRNLPSPICCWLRHPPSDPKGDVVVKKTKIRTIGYQFLNTPHYQYLFVYWLFYYLMSITLIYPFQFRDLGFQLDFHSKQQISSTYQQNLDFTSIHYLFALFIWYWRGTMWHIAFYLYPPEQSHIDMVSEFK